MKVTAKIRKFKGKKFETIKEVRAALIAILEDIESGERASGVARHADGSRPIARGYHGRRPTAADTGCELLEENGAIGGSRGPQR